MEIATTAVRLCLGSSSVHRRAVVQQAFGAAFQLSQCSPDIDEKAIRHDDPATLTMLIARAKMAAVMAKLAASAEADAERQVMPDFVVTSDQVATHGGVIREKPETEEENREFLRSYRNGSVVTIASFVVRNVRTGIDVEGTHECETFFGDVTEAMIECVVARGVTMWCAGGFAIEDEDLHSVLLRVRNGNAASVQGVHLPLFRELLAKAGAPASAVGAEADGA
jgi:septum formation protein